MEKIFYSKNHFVHMVNSETSEDRVRLIHITISTQTTNKNELIVKLSGENDPFFLYSLYLNEDNYQPLKASQELVDEFSSFGERLISLLKDCEKYQTAEKPR